MSTSDHPSGTDRPSRTDRPSGTDADGLLAEQLLRLTRRLHRIQKHHLEPVGITPAQSRLLRTVAHFGEPPRMADLATRLEVVPRAVTSLVDGLEAGGRVRRVPDPSNRRVVRIELTDAGRATLRELRSARRAAAEDILAPLTVDQREVLGGLLSALVDRVPESGC
ncbi:Transcriptional regulator, MarR family [Streptomyces venezuelae]|uniref:MarR family winged helix-turn-helix transcriptional regulator n=1 Tax=Streptomyces gardneri TaxID=66892 RepID=UPI0006BDBDBA|nr:MarR family transcriptional regulator [Streptomyces gardneri]ALO06795.1 Transcriptional regulator, MarR family [Streptomyces venezuelae]QPK44185.1 MarR family transcriptional regulator [Streptomyces gardneri]WRK35466.1 MarR family transcriptional regulator [Streptomyces venezuelae]CUM42910.1 Transcriptional regulator, MarR family [Streptomyces venezuelae]